VKHSLPLVALCQTNNLFEPSRLERLDSDVRQAEVDRGGARRFVDQLEPALGAQDVDGRLECVGGRTVGRDDRDAGAVLDSQTGRRIDDVGVTVSIDNHKSLGIARGRNGRVRKQEHAQRLRLAPFQGRDGHLPAACVRRGIADRDIASPSDQGLLDAVGLEHIEGSLCRVSLGDSADV